MARYSVTKCVCHDQSFKALKAYAREHHIDSVDELQERNICSCGCQRCKPYVEQMLKTGKTAFEPGASCGHSCSNSN